jgi:oligoendopeptidase F
VRKTIAAADQIAQRYKGRIRKLDDLELLEAFRQYQECIAAIQRLAALAEILLSSGFASESAAAISSLGDRAWAALAARLDFFESELAQVPRAEAEKLTALGPDGIYHNFYCRVTAATQPSPEISSALAALQPTGIDGWQALARQLFARIEVAGATEATSLGAAQANLYLPDRDLRRRSHAAITAALEPDLELRATTLAMIAADGVARADLCGTGWLHDSLLSDQLTEAEVEALTGHASEAYPLAHEYFGLKQRLLGVSNLMDYDRYAPVAADEPLIPWTEALAIVLDTFDAVQGSFGQAARRLVAAGQVDAALRRGKAAGAFTKEVPGASPYISMNFNGSLRSVLTLAHELGHGVHMEATRHLPLLAASTPRVLAETVALFFESVTLRSLLRSRSSADEQLSLAARATENHLIAICRHAALYKFECGLRSSDDTASLDAGAIGSSWLATQHEFYGNAVELTAGFRSWWGSLEGLFLAPGSSYSYLYGLFAAAALTEQYEIDPAGCGERLVKLAAAGGTASPRQLLSAAGVDCLSESTRELAFQAFDRALSDLRCRVPESVAAR